MASLKEIRRRIHSINNIEQITKSMEMIAAARFQRAQMKAYHSNRYTHEMRTIISHLIENQVERNYPLFMKGKGPRHALVIAGADRGLCGAYNSNLFNVVDLFLKKFSLNEVELILFGRKAIEHYTRKKWNIGFAMPEWGGKITFAAIQELTDSLIEKFLMGSYASIQLMYTQHQTIFSREVINAPLLPIEVSHKDQRSLKKDYIFEPTIEELLAGILREYCLAEIHNMLNQAYASELAARVCAMRAASKNAQEIKEQLTLERNKLRQTSITKEVLEISSGAESL